MGPKLAKDLVFLGIAQVDDLREANPEALYAMLCERVGEQVDRCVLYVFRCACYFATTEQPDPELLRWWNWKGRRFPE